MEVLGLLRPQHNMEKQENDIKQYCDKNGLKHYITVFNNTDELTFADEHKTLVFASPNVLTANELESVRDYAKKKNKEIVFCE